MFFQKFFLVVLLLSHINAIWSATTRNESLILDRIRDGNNADIKNAGFQVSIRKRAKEIEKYGNGIDCGGSLISENVVLTASHCFLSNYLLVIYGKPEDYVAVMGNTNYMQSDEHTLQFNIKNFSVAKFTEYMENDIALAFLDGKVAKNHPTAKPVTLNSGPLKNGIICQAYGWGFGAIKKASEYLQVVDLPVITSEYCRTYSNYGENLRNCMFCAGYLVGGRAACTGDSGGPLVCGGVQIGIMSWIQGCGEPRRPAVFTDVALYNTWILKHVALNDATDPIFENV